MAECADWVKFYCCVSVVAVSNYCYVTNDDSNRGLFIGQMGATHLLETSFVNMHYTSTLLSIRDFRKIILLNRNS